MEQFPDQRRAIARLRKLIESLRKRSDGGEKPLELTFEHIYNKTGFSSPEALAVALADLVSRGEIQKFVRVESPTTGGGIGDFESLQAIPETVYDWRSDQEFIVTPGNVRVMFKMQHA